MVFFTNIFHVHVSLFYKCVSLCVVNISVPFFYGTHMYPFMCEKLSQIQKSRPCCLFFEFSFVYFHIFWCLQFIQRILRSFVVYIYVSLFCSHMHTHINPFIFEKYMRAHVSIASFSGDSPKFIPTHPMQSLFLIFFQSVSIIQRVFRGLFSVLRHNFCVYLCIQVSKTPLCIQVSKTPPPRLQWSIFFYIVLFFRHTCLLKKITKKCLKMGAFLCVKVSEDGCILVCHSRIHPFSDTVLQCVAVCCSVLQCVAVCCSVLQCVAVSRCRMHPSSDT